jgi:iron only hydrogenase large subunit-like protein
MKRIALILMTLAVLLVFASCGNQDCLDTNYTMEYIVIHEGEEYVLHTVDSWGDSQSDSVTVTTACCGNYIWTSVNSATLYRSKPSQKAYTHVCDGENP